MKTYTIAALFIFAVAVGTVVSNPTDSDFKDVEPLNEADKNEELDMQAMFACLGNKLTFNGRKTCQVGCRAACLQPGCDGFKKCIQIPNPGESSTYLHKYKCNCNN